MVKEMKKEPLNFAKKTMQKDTVRLVQDMTDVMRANSDDLHQKLTNWYGIEEYEAVLNMKATDSSCSGMQEYLVDRLYQFLEGIEGVSSICEFTKELIRKLIFPQETSVGECLTSSPILIAKFKKFCQPLTENLLPNEKAVLQEALDLFMEKYKLGALSLRGYWQEPTVHETSDFEAFLDGVATKIEKKFKKSKLNVVSKIKKSATENIPVSELKDEALTVTAIESLLKSDSKEEIPLGIRCLATFFSELLCETFHQLQSRCNVFQLALKLFPKISKKTRFQNLFPMGNNKNIEEEQKLLAVKEYFEKNHSPCIALIEDFWLEEKHQNLYSFAEFILQTTRFVTQALKEKLDLSEST